MLLVKEDKSINNLKTANTIVLFLKLHFRFYSSPTTYLLFHKMLHVEDKFYLQLKSLRVDEQRAPKRFRKTILLNRLVKELKKNLVGGVGTVFRK